MTALKEKGNKALAENKFDEAIAAYTEAIGLDGQNHDLCSNRSTAYLIAGKYEEALIDADKTISLNRFGAKGYSRKALALFGMEKYQEAFAVCSKGIYSFKYTIQEIIILNYF